MAARRADAAHPYRRGPFPDVHVRSAARGVVCGRGARRRTLTVGAYLRLPRAFRRAAQTVFDQSEGGDAVGALEDAIAALLRFGGERGIRTLGRALRPYGGLANRWL